MENIAFKELMPREKLVNKGPEFLTDAELLAIFLRTGLVGKPVMALSKKYCNILAAYKPF